MSSFLYRIRTFAENEEGSRLRIHQNIRLAVCLLGSALLAVALVLVLTLFYRPAYTRGPSMEPTLADGDWSIAWIYDYTPARGDVVIIRDMHTADKYIVKRIIGLPGDLIDIDFATGEVFRNGRVLTEPYATEPTLTAGDIRFPLSVPQDHVFVMGDNRNHSTDSRTSYTGMIAGENIEGRVLCRVYPLPKLGLIE